MDIPNTVFVACIQLCSTTDIEQNWQKTEAMIRQAAQRGAQLICTPENTLFLGPQFHKVGLAQSVDGEWGQRFSALAKELSVHILVGSVAEKRVLPDGSVDDKKCYNTSLLFDDTGVLLASYRKIHLFDVDVPGGLTIAESDTICAGDSIIVVPTKLGCIGMSICYDLRFPEMYRKLVDAGAEIIAIPSAFTLTTGKDHWHTLLRARAIETETWVIAPGQWGTHDTEGKRKSYGHSVIIDPWGVVISDAGEGERTVYAEIDRGQISAVRQAIPVHKHRRLF